MLYLKRFFGRVNITANIFNRLCSATYHLFGSKQVSYWLESNQYFSKMKKTNIQITWFYEPSNYAELTALYFDILRIVSYDVYKVEIRP